MVYFQPSYSEILVGGHGEEYRLWESECFEDVPSHADDVVRLDDMNAWLVFMHRVQYDLYTMTRKQKETTPDDVSLTGGQFGSVRYTFKNSHFATGLVAARLIQNKEV